MDDFNTKLERALRRQRGELPAPGAQAAEFVRLAQEQGEEAAVAYLLSAGEDAIPYILARIAGALR